MTVLDHFHKSVVVPAVIADGSDEVMPHRLVPIGIPSPIIDIYLKTRPSGYKYSASPTRGVPSLFPYQRAAFP